MKTTGRKLLSGCMCCVEPSPFTSTAVSRRSFLAGGTAAVGAAASPFLASPIQAQTPPAKARRIDVHHHVVPTAQAKAFTDRGSRPPRWSVQASLEDMDKGGVATSITSIINPGVWFGEAGELPRDHWLILTGRYSARPELRGRTSWRLNGYRTGSKWFSAPYTIVAPVSYGDGTSQPSGR